MPKSKDMALSDKAIKYIIVALLVGGLLGYYLGKAKERLSSKYKDEIKVMLRQNADEMKKTGEMMKDAGTKMKESGDSYKDDEMMRYGLQLEEKGEKMMDDGTLLLQDKDSVLQY